MIGSEPITENPLVMEVIVGAGIAIGAAIPAHLLLRLANLSWSWGVPFAGAGGIALGVGPVGSWAVALAGGGLLTARWSYLLERRDRESGGDKRRRARDAFGIRDAVGWLAARRLRKGEVRVQTRKRRKGLRRVPEQRFVLGADRRGRFVSLRMGAESGRHALMLGASGSGKTTSLKQVVLAHLKAGRGAVVVDMKADIGLREFFLWEGACLGTPLAWWSLDPGEDWNGPGYWNPLARGNPSELKDKLIGCEEFSERHYEAMYERYLLNLFRALDGPARAWERNLRKVVDLLDPSALLADLRHVKDEEVASEIERYLRGLTPDQHKHLHGLQDRLALLVEGGHGKYLTGSDIDLLDTVAKGGLVLFSLDSSRFGATAKLVGNLVIQDLKTICGQLESQPNLKRPSLLAVDEFSGLDADHIAGLFQRGRSAGMSVLLATQEFADMRRVEDRFCDQVVGNVEWILAGRQNNPESAELVAGIAGTEEVWTHTFQTEDRLSQLQKDGQFWRESGMGTKHVGREFLVSPDEIKRLGVGRAVLIEKNPNRTKVLKVRAPGERVRRMERSAA